MGYKKLDGYGKPYYVNYNEGKVYRVYSTTQLKELKDGATATEYGYLKLKNIDGSRSDIATHQLIVKGGVPNFKRKRNVHHIDGIKSHNYSSNLLPVTTKQHWKADILRRNNSPEYMAYIESIQNENEGR